jgi:hypothetical protein
VFKFFDGWFFYLMRDKSLSFYFFKKTKNHCFPGTWVDFLMGVSKDRDAHLFIFA